MENKMSNHTPQKTVIITGANSGLGFECAKSIAHARQGWHIVLACRNNKKGMQAVDSITSATGNENVSMLQVDLSSLESVRSFVNEYQKNSYPYLKGLICNAGIRIPEGTQYTKEGYELTFGVNHLGHFLLTNLLLDQFVEPGRIIVVSSYVHNSGVPQGKIVSATYLDAKLLAHPGTNQEISGTQRYAISKLCNILFAYELNRKLRERRMDITVNAFDPGLVLGTNLFGESRNLRRTILGSWFGRKFLEMRGIVASTPKKSGRAMGRLLLDSQLEKVSGKYFQILKEIPSSEDSYNQENAKELWESSKELTNFQESNTKNSSQ
jgi:light-dependent protochlorophyllide reductase